LEFINELLNLYATQFKQINIRPTLWLWASKVKFSLQIMQITKYPLPPSVNKSFVNNYFPIQKRYCNSKYQFPVELIPKNTGWNSSNGYATNRSSKYIQNTETKTNVLL